MVVGALLAGCAGTGPNPGFSQQKHCWRVGNRVGDRVMTNKTLKLILAPMSLLLPACALTGCKSTSGAEYLSPRVVGRVLDAQSREPIDGVRVKRLDPGSGPYNTLPRKGGEILMQPPPIYTGKDGRFVIVSERDLAPFAKMNWYSIDVLFEHAGYEGLLTNYTLLNATNLPSGEPLVDTGNILLQRRLN
jgi:hypothetical protein